MSKWGGGVATGKVAGVKESCSHRDSQDEVIGLGKNANVENLGHLYLEQEKVRKLPST